MQADTVLEVRALSKSFPGIRALDTVKLVLERGKVHALLGENGAGKSTLVKTLLGLHSPDSGEILFHGSPVQLRDPHHARQLGIAMVHQELMGFPELTVAENIFIGQEPCGRWPGCVDRRRMEADAAAVLARLGVSLEPTVRLGTLTVAQRQMVEIARALSHRAEVIILDEPTSALSDREVEALMRVVDDLRSQGVAVVYISHKLEEVFRLADTVTVLRDGRWVGTYPVTEVDRHRLIALMVGRDLEPAPVTAGRAPGEVALAVRELGRAGRFRKVSFELARGEVLGMAGLMGAGRTDVAHALYGLAPADEGEIRIAGQPRRITAPRDALRHGLALVTEDRKEHGLVLPLPVKHNLTLAALQRFCRGGLIDHRAEEQITRDQTQALSVKASSPLQRVGELSGGNQQKVLLARALLVEPSVLILDEPTRGIDLGAKAEIYALIRRLADAGMAILLISSELPELLALCDRLLVMRQGTISAELDPRRTTSEEILHWAMPV